MAKDDNHGPFGAPKGRHDLDDDFWKEAKAWIEDIHPVSCAHAFEAMFELHPYTYDGAFSLLLGHLVDIHAAGMSEIARVCGHLYHLNDEIEGPVLDAIRAHSGRLREEILERWEELEESPGGPEAAHVFFRSLPTDELAALVEELCATDHPDRGPAIFDRALRAFAYPEEQSEAASAFFERNFERIVRMYPDHVVSYLLHSKGLEGIKDRCLDRLLETGGEDAARLIIGKFLYEEPHPIILRSLQVLLDANPDDPMTDVGLVLALDIDAEQVLPILVDRVNALGGLSRFHGHLAWKMQQWDVSRLLDGLAEDALKKDEIIHDHLADTHFFLLRDAAVFCRWIKVNGIDEGNKRYVASIITSILSNDDKVGDEDRDALIEAAHKLHGRFGNHSLKEVQTATKLESIRGQPRHKRLLAIALAKDVLREPYVLKADEVLRRLKDEYPFTYKALGEQTLDDHIAKGEKFPFALMYEDGYEEMYRESEEALSALKEGEEPREIDVLRFLSSARTLHTRELWEQRFKVILEAGYTVREGSLRKDYSYWVEMGFLAALAPHFEVVVEPDFIPNLEDKRPDFLLRSPDGEMILEVTHMEEGPDDVSDGVKTSLGLEVQKRIEKKWRKQFKMCEVDTGYPVVVAVEMRFPHQVQHDMRNSLYGPFQVTWGRDTQTGDTVTEGVSRDDELAFFKREKVECISAIVGISPPEPESEYPNGELFRPIREPLHPIPLPLWVRLRNALFGPEPQYLLDEMGRIPTITEDEVRKLVARGIDHWQLFASGHFPFDEEIGIPEDRYFELRREAQRLDLIYRKDRLEYLPSAAGRDLTPFHEVKIFTLKQLLAADERPPSVPEDLWDVLREEASHFD